MTESVAKRVAVAVGLVIAFLLIWVSFQGEIVRYAVRSAFALCGVLTMTWLRSDPDWPGEPWRGYVLNWAAVVFAGLMMPPS